MEVDVPDVALPAATQNDSCAKEVPVSKVIWEERVSWKDTFPYLRANAVLCVLSYAAWGETTVASVSSFTSTHDDAETQVVFEEISWRGKDLESAGSPGPGLSILVRIWFQILLQLLKPGFEPSAFVDASYLCIL